MPTAEDLAYEFEFEDNTDSSSSSVILLSPSGMLKPSDASSSEAIMAADGAEEANPESSSQIFRSEESNSESGAHETSSTSEVEQSVSEPQKIVAVSKPAAKDEALTPSDDEYISDEDICDEIFFDGVPESGVEEDSPKPENCFETTFENPSEPTVETTAPEPMEITAENIVETSIQESTVEPAADSEEGTSKIEENSPEIVTAENIIDITNEANIDDKYDSDAESVDDLDSESEANSIIIMHNDDSLRALLHRKHIATVRPNGSDGLSIVSERYLTYRISDSVGEQTLKFTGRRLLKTGKFSDVDILAGSNSTPIKAHKGVLAEKSGYFADLFAENKDLSTTSLEDRHYGTIKAIVRYCYTGKIRHSYHPGYVTRLYFEAEYLRIPELKEHAHNFLKDMMSPESPIFVNEYKPAAYLLCMLKGLRENKEKWRTFRPLFGLVVRRAEFDEWIEKRELLDWLEAHGTACAYLLRENNRVKIDYQRLCEAIAGP